MQANEIIKRLGYEKAKVMLQGLGNEYNAALLEYRRQNGFFEVGDTVVIINHPTASKGTYQVREPINSNSVGIAPICKSGNVLDMCAQLASPYYLRHAEDMEIEAQRQLDLPKRNSIIKANFKNAAGEYIQVIGKVRELKGRTICCNEVGTGKPFFCLPGEFKKYDLPESVILSLGEVS